MDEATPSPAAGVVSGRVSLRMGAHTVDLDATVPAGAVPLRSVLPLARLLSDAIVAVAEAEVRASGEQVSCKAGCGACCRQLVPVSLPELHALKDVVEAMPEPRRTHVRERFAEATRQAQSSGWLDRAKPVIETSWMDVEMVRLGVEYFQLGIPCPFLEDESCSIYPDRPTACREFLVLSPAENCRVLGPDSIRRVNLHGRVSRALRDLGSDARGRRWLPLTFLLQGTEDDADQPRTMAGTAWAEALFREVTGKDIPKGAGASMADDA